MKITKKFDSHGSRNQVVVDPLNNHKILILGCFNQPKTLYHGRLESPFGCIPPLLAKGSLEIFIRVKISQKEHF
jgi:hypothetical protein